MKVKWIAVAVASVIVVGVVAGFGGYTLGVKAGQTRAADIRTNFLAARGAGTGQQGAGMPGQGAPGMPGAPAVDRPAARTRGRSSIPPTSPRGRSSRWMATQCN